MIVNQDVKELLRYLNQVRVAHWQARSQVVHETMGAFYDALEEFIDQLVEASLKYARLGNEVLTLAIEVKPVDAEWCAQLLNEIKEFLANKLPAAWKNEGYFAAIGAEFMVEIDRTIYRLSLK